MTDSRKPFQIIADLAENYGRLTDDGVLAALAAIPPLVDESDPSWREMAYWHQVAYPYVALWDVVAERRLRAAIPMILDRACFGDPGEIMRGVRHTLEAIVNPDWDALVGPCVAALSSPRAGTRMWAADVLGPLCDPAAAEALERATRDPVAEVRKNASRALARL